MLEQFYRDVLPQGGYYALFLGQNKQHVWFRTIDELVETTERWDDVPDLYFATAAFKTAENRKAENVRALRAFRLDIDAGEKKYAKHGDSVYPTQEAALAGLVAFSKACDLPPSYVVSSGAGLHIYYCLDHDADPSDWVPVAERLKEITSAHGLRADPNVTADTARVLRPLGALHHSGAQVSLLRRTGHYYSLESFALRLGPAPTPKYDLSINQEVLEAPQGPPKTIVKIIQHCAAMAHAGREQASIPEPYWRAMLGVCKHTVEGDEAAHRLSEEHPDYDWRETQNKLDHWTTGPATCHEFSQHFPGCRQCKFWGQIKSPIVLGAMNVEEVRQLPPEQQPEVHVPSTPPGAPWEDKIPAPFFINDQHALCVKRPEPSKNLAGEATETVLTTVITSTPFWFESRAKAADNQDHAVVTMHVWDESELVYTMDQELLATRKDSYKFLASKGIHLRSGSLRTTKAMDDYLRAQLERIRTMHTRPKINDRFGLRIDERGQLVAVHGKYVIHPDGNIVEAMLGDRTSKRAEHFPIAQLRDCHQTRFGPEVWPKIRAGALRYVEFVREYYSHPDLEPFQLTIMMLLASPLMAFVTGQYVRGTTLPSNGLTLSLYSRETSRGKTYATKVGMAAFGDPDMLVKARDENATTENARRTMLSVHGTMPVVMDEMGHANAQTIASLVSAVANGASKERLDSKYGTETPWALINVITCNHAQRELINQAQAESAAIQMRLLEIDVNKIPNRPPEVREAFERDFAQITQHCAGSFGAFLGLMFAKIGAQKLNERVMAAVKRASAAAGNSQEGRFQWRAFGAVLALQDILEQVGLAMFDTATLTKVFVDAFHAGSEYVEEYTLPVHGQDLIGLAINELKPYTLITDTETHRGHNPLGRDIVLNIGGAPKKVVARHVQKGGYTYVSIEALRDWCSTKRVSFNSMIKDCIKSEVIVRMSKEAIRGTVDLYKGTAEDGTGALTSVYKVNINRLKYELVDYSENVVPLHIAKMDQPDANTPYEETK